MKILKHPTFWILIYLFIVLAYTLCFWKLDPSPKVFLTSNELGDFLAGAFAPIAFIFLYLGYRQQDQAIKANNQAILSQLEIQKMMLELQNDERKEREHAAQPILDLQVTAVDLPYDTERLNLETSRPYESFKRRFKFEITNSGEKISQVNIRCIEPFQKTKSISFNRVLSESSPLVAYLYIKEFELEEFNSIDAIDLIIQIDYRTNLGMHYKLKYEVTTPTYGDTPDLVISFTAKSSPIKIN